MQHRRPAPFPLFLLLVASLFAVAACSVEPSVVDADGQSRAGSVDPDQSDPNADPRFELRGELPISTAAVNEIIDFIEDETGKPFLRPPVIVGQTADEFAAGLAPQTEEFLAEADNAIRQLQALGLTDKGVTEVSGSFIALLNSPDAGVQGYYDTETDELYVPIDVLGDDAFLTLLAHELTHALDSQHSDLMRMDVMADEAETTGDYEALRGLQAVIEGRATAVDERWRKKSGGSVDEPNLALVEQVPPAILLDLGIAYSFGEQLINANGGPASTWDLLEDPPTTTEEILTLGSGERYGAAARVEVPTPSADGPVLDTSVFGAADLLVLLLGETLEPGQLVVLRSLDAADGWAGGEGILWGDDQESCLRVSFAADTANDLAEIGEALSLWAAEASTSTRTVTTNDSLVTLTGCAPYIP